MNSFTQKVVESLHKNSIEPEKRMVAGHYSYAHHRFPIKNGISVIDVMQDSINKPNKLYERLVK